MKDSWILGFLSVMALSFMLAMVWQYRAVAFSGANDFVAFYSGAHLLGTPDLYNNERLHEMSGRHTGVYSREHGYVRLPFHAVFVWPLSRLPYRTAYLLYTLASVAAFVGFIVLWRPPNVSLTLLFSMLSLPAFVTIMDGQDDTFLLFFLAATAALMHRGRSFAAGLVFSLCAIKFHLFLLTPVLILGQRNWRFARGLLAGGGVLLAISFLAAGWSWPLEFFASVSTPAFTPNARSMPNLHGAFFELSWGWALEILFGASLVAATWIVARRMSFPYALACSLAGGLLLSFHAYLLDFSLLLPASLAALAMSQLSLLRAVAVFLLAPPAHFAVVYGFPYSVVMVAVVVLFIYLMAYEARRTGTSPSPSFGPTGKLPAEAPDTASGGS